MPDNPPQAFLEASFVFVAAEFARRFNKGVALRDSVLDWLHILSLRTWRHGLKLSLQE